MKKTYEIKLATGWSIEQLENSVNKIANIRQDEIDKMLDAGMDVLDREDYWFKPIGVIETKFGNSLEYNRCLTLLMIRISP